MSVTRRRRALRIAGWGCATVLVATAGAAGVLWWRVDRLLHGDRRALAAALAGGRTAAPHGAVDVALDGCTLYRTPHGTDDWQAVDLPYAAGDYPAFMTACTRAALQRDADHVTASLCAQAIGAGGGCARGGTFRSRDGIAWERLAR